MKSVDAQNALDDVPPSNVEEALQRMSGVDLTSINGIDTNTALKILAEIGTVMNRWKTTKHFASWLGLSPDIKVSGGKVLSSATKPVANKATSAFRMAAFTLFNSKSAVGAYLEDNGHDWGRPGQSPPPLISWPVWSIPCSSKGPLMSIPVRNITKNAIDRGSYKT